MDALWVEERADGLLYVAGSRIPLANVVLALHEGNSPEAIRQSYTVLSPEQIRGAVQFCEAEPAIAERQVQMLDEIERTAELQAPPLSPRLRQKLAGLAAKHASTAESGR